MPAYSIALFIHILSLSVATVAIAIAAVAALRLRTAANAEEAARWLGVVGKVVPAFPAATLGLLASGAYMTYLSWTWSTPWILSGLAGLAVIVAMGSGIEASRGRALKRELDASGLSEKARAMLRDPAAWTAKLITMTMVIAEVFVMTVKPSAIAASLCIVGAVVAGALAAVPFWRPQPAGSKNRHTSRVIAERTSN